MFAAMEEEEPLLRLMPSVSLAEDALVALVELVEVAAGDLTSMVLQVKLHPALGHLTALVQYSTSAETDAFAVTAVVAPVAGG